MICSLKNFQNFKNNFLSAFLNSNKRNISQKVLRLKIPNKTNWLTFQNLNETKNIGLVDKSNCLTNLDQLNHLNILEHPDHLHTLGDSNNFNTVDKLHDLQDDLQSNLDELNNSVNLDKSIDFDNSTNLSDSMETEIETSGTLDTNDTLSPTPIDVLNAPPPNILFETFDNNSKFPEVDNSIFSKIESRQHFSLLDKNVKIKKKDNSDLERRENLEEAKSLIEKYLCSIEKNITQDFTNDNASDLQVDNFYQILQIDKTGYLPLKIFPSNLLNPYDFYNNEKPFSSRIDEFDDQEKINQLSQQKKTIYNYKDLNSFQKNYDSYLFNFSMKNKFVPRLSVTKILTNTFCEFKYIYEIYNKNAPEKSKAMFQGQKIHSILENSIYPDKAELLNNFVERYTIGSQLPLRKNVDIMGYQLFSNTIKFKDLFFIGESRENQIHGFINTNTLKIVGSHKPESRNDSENENNDLLISGIIDHLILTKTNHKEIAKRMDFETNTKYLQGFNESLDLNKYSNDLNDFIEKFSEDSVQDAFLKENFRIIVSDVKTRGIKRKPDHQNVIDGSKLQIQIYRSFLEILSDDVENSYWSIIKSLQKRNLDVDEPLSKEYMFIYLKEFPEYFSDMVRLSKGKKIGFEDFGGNITLNQKKPEIKIETDTKETLRQENSSSTIFPIFKGEDEKMNDLLIDWKSPLTLRYLAYRLSQVLGIFKKFLSDELKIEYYSNKEFGQSFLHVNFNKLPKDELDKVIESNMELILGKRNPDLNWIGKDMRKVEKYCKYCNFREKCGWRNYMKL
ncbi:Exo5p ASCRUDRAFT_75585 [Ascoidea rubescens DSM 1968]|uniref:Exonuclease V, mitochondrial n=1 Tax=Ascoidea rubescens DSM 1968 TaxID=1344418 RepID=A0A1D2VJ72_9ASCO|nr:hypothetical protein ASCRUDRAFT_75585 [Ascoidea rubescens DSM 1968]ODV61593.1 hypothetical protein ASCRUDRAFT_75585 [Ascoidea rubescens DSM 1968]